MAVNTQRFNFVICIVVVWVFLMFVSCQDNGVSDHLKQVVKIMNTVSSMDSLQGLTSNWSVNTQGGAVRIATKPEGIGEMWQDKTEPSPSPSTEGAKSPSQYQQSYDQLLSLQESQGFKSPITEILEASTPEPEEENTIELPLIYSPISLTPFSPLPPLTSQPLIPKNQLAESPNNSPLPIPSPLPLPLPLDTNGQGVVGGAPSPTPAPVANVSNMQLQQSFQQFQQLDNLFEFERDGQAQQLEPQEISSSISAEPALSPEVEDEDSTPVLSLPALGVAGAPPNQQAANIQDPFAMMAGDQVSPSPDLPFFMQGGNFSFVKIPTSNESVPSFLTQGVTPISSSSQPPAFLMGPPIGINNQQQSTTNIQGGINNNNNNNFLGNTQGAYSQNVQGGQFNIQGGQMQNNIQGGINNNNNNNIQGGVQQNIQGGSQQNIQGGLSNNLQGGNQQNIQGGNIQGGSPSTNQVTYAPSQQTCGRSDNPGPGTLCGCTNQVACGFYACMEIYARDACDNPDVVASSAEVPFGYCDVTCGRCDCCPSVLQQSQNLNLTMWYEMVQIVLEATGSDMASGGMGPTGSVITALNNPSNTATIFVPTDEAFERLLVDKLDETKENFLTKIPALMEIIQTHMVLGSAAMTAQQLRDGELTYSLPTQQAGQNSAFLIIDEGDSVETMTITSPGATARIQQPDVNGCQTIMHIIDEVFLPFVPESNTG